MITRPRVVSNFAQYSSGPFSGRGPFVVSTDEIAGSCVAPPCSHPIATQTTATRKTIFGTRSTFIPPTHLANLAEPARILGPAFSDPFGPEFLRPSHLICL